jgi:hypothetical protein
MLAARSFCSIRVLLSLACRCPVRRCLHTLLIALLALALSTDAARACWFLRARRQCRPAVVSRPSPPPASSGCGEVVVVQKWSVQDGCCPPAVACCEESVVVAHESAPASEVIGDRDAESLTQSVVREQPTLAGDGQAPVDPTDPPPEPPAPRSELVQPASNNEPLPDLEPVEPVEDLPAGDPKGDSPLSGTVPEADPEMQDDDLPPADVAEEEMQDEDAPGLPLPPVTEAPADEAEERADKAPPRRPLPPLPGIDDDEPPMEEEAAEPAIEAADPVEPAPAVEPEPEPEAEPNLFEEFEDGDTAGADAEEEMAEEEMVEEDAAGSLFPGDDDPIPPAGPAAEPADLPFDDDPIADGTDPLMADDEDAAAPAPDVVGDSEDEPLPAPADDSDPFAETDDPDSLASAEPVRRWIHASGAHSLVARLVEVEADGSCLLETEGRQIRVPLANLSGHDRDYLRAAGVRLAALREARERAAAATSTPQATDTAGL